MKYAYIYNNNDNELIEKLITLGVDQDHIYKDYGKYPTSQLTLSILLRNNKDKQQLYLYYKDKNPTVNLFIKNCIQDDIEIINI